MFAWARCVVGTRTATWIFIFLKGHKSRPPCLGDLLVFNRRVETPIATRNLSIWFSRRHVLHYGHQCHLLARRFFLLEWNAEWKKFYQYIWDHTGIGESITKRELHAGVKFLVALGRINGIYFCGLLSISLGCQFGHLQMGPLYRPWLVFSERAVIFDKSRRHKSVARKSLSWHNEMKKPGGFWTLRRLAITPSGSSSVSCPMNGKQSLTPIW